MLCSSANRIKFVNLWFQLSGANGMAKKIRYRSLSLNAITWPSEWHQKCNKRPLMPIGDFWPPLWGKTIENWGEHEIWENFDYCLMFLLLVFAAKERNQKTRKKTEDPDLMSHGKAIKLGTLFVAPRSGKKWFKEPGDHWQLLKCRKNPRIPVPPALARECVVIILWASAPSRHFWRMDSAKGKKSQTRV